MGKLDAPKDSQTLVSAKSGGYVGKSIKMLMLLSLAATQSAARAEDPQKKDGPMNQTEEVAPKIDFLPSGLQDLPADHPLVVSWEEVQTRLESWEIKEQGANYEVDTYDQNRWTWDDASKAVLKLRELSPSNPDTKGHYHYNQNDPHTDLWVEINAKEVRNGNQLIDLTLKVSTERNTHFVCDEKNQLVSKDQNTITVLQSLGKVSFHVVDAEGQVVAKGQTGENGVGTVTIPEHTARPCKVQFDQENIEGAQNISVEERSGKSNATLELEEESLAEIS